MHVFYIKREFIRFASIICLEWFNSRESQNPMVIRSLGLGSPPPPPHPLCPHSPTLNEGWGFPESISSLVNMRILKKLFLTSAKGVSTSTSSSSKVDEFTSESKGQERKKTFLLCLVSKQLLESSAHIQSGSSHIIKAVSHRPHHLNSALRFFPSSSRCVTLTVQANPTLMH